jgi:hypothetical protein
MASPVCIAHIARACDDVRTLVASADAPEAAFGTPEQAMTKLLTRQARDDDGGGCGGGV